MSKQKPKTYEKLCGTSIENSNAEKGSHQQTQHNTQRATDSIIQGLVSKARLNAARTLEQNLLKNIFKPNPLWERIGKNLVVDPMCPPGQVYGINTNYFHTPMVSNQVSNIALDLPSTRKCKHQVIMLLGTEPLGDMTCLACNALIPPRGYTRLGNDES